MSKRTGSSLALHPAVTGLFVASIGIVYLAVWTFPIISNIRIPLLSASFLVGVPLLVRLLDSSLVSNLFIVEAPKRHFYVYPAVYLWGASIMLSASTALITTKSLHHLRNAGWDRSADVTTLIFLSPFAPWVALCLATPLLWYVSDRTLREIKTKDLKQGLTRKIVGGAATIVFLAAGLSVAVKFVVVEVPSELAEPVGNFLLQSLPVETNVAEEIAGTLPSHLFALLILCIFAILYVTSGRYLRPTVYNSVQAATLFHLATLFSLITLTLGAIDFWARYFPSMLFPIGAGLLVASLVFALLFDNRHEYKLLETSAGKEDETEGCPDHSASNNRSCPPLENAVAKRLSRSDNEEILTVACLKGGGIHAAAWAAKVLTGLQEELGTSFTKSIGLVSGVSGGAVGSMFYLNRFTPDGYPSEDELDRVVSDACKDCLDALGWGIVYLDFWRAFGITAGWGSQLFSKGELQGRGEAIEVEWNRTLQEARKSRCSSSNQCPANFSGTYEPCQCTGFPTLGTWRPYVVSGSLPVPVFNATVVNTGQRYLISPISFPEVKPDDGQSGAVSFTKVFPENDLHISTAARLSSTFPYVAPISVNSTPSAQSYDLYAADGGYFDNFGIHTAVDALRSLFLSGTKPGSTHLPNVRRIVVLVVDPFPPEDLERPEGETLTSDRLRSWSMAAYGPLQAMMNARRSTQLAFVWDQLALLKSSLAAVHNINLDIVRVPFPIDEYPGFRPPLSWKLAPNEIDKVHRGWETALKRLRKSGDLDRLNPTFDLIDNA